MSTIQEWIKDNQSYTLPVWIKVRLVEDYFSPVTHILYKAGSEFVGTRHTVDEEKKTFTILKDAIPLDPLPSFGSIYGEGFGNIVGELVEIWQGEITAKKLWSKE